MKLSILCLTAAVCLLTACGGSTANNSNANDEGLFTRITHMLQHDPDQTNYVGSYMFQGSKGVIDYEMVLESDSTGSLTLFLPQDDKIHTDLTWTYLDEQDAAKITLENEELFDLPGNKAEGRKNIYLVHDTLFQNEFGFKTKTVLLNGTIVIRK